MSFTYKPRSREHMESLANPSDVGGIGAQKAEEQIFEFFDKMYLSLVGLFIKRHKDEIETLRKWGNQEKKRIREFIDVNVDNADHHRRKHYQLEKQWDHWSHLRKKVLNNIEKGDTSC